MNKSHFHATRFTAIRRKSKAAFTLVELLVVIAIIGILIALLMPAVNSSRERARFAMCANNVKQLAAANIQHEATFQYLPTGGWGWGWVGDPSRGNDYHQPGGWIYNILPYIEQKDLHDMIDDTARASIPTAITICPTRRTVQAFLHNVSSSPTVQTDYTTPATEARSDYASNAGDVFSEPDAVYLWNGGSLGSNCGSNPACGPVVGQSPAPFPSDAILLANQAKSILVGTTGIIFTLSTLKTSSIKDGMSFTYMLGEKRIPSLLNGTNAYLNGSSGGDNENQYIGFNADIARWTDLAPAQDQPNNDDVTPPYNQTRFGSAHQAGFNMAFCDGSVKKISYDIDAAIHKQLGNRSDGGPLQLEGSGIGGDR